MDINLTLENLLKQKERITAKGILNSALIFLVDDKLICTIRKNDKEYHDEDNFKLFFYEETFQTFHSEEYFNGIVMYGKFNSYSTEINDKEFEEELLNIDLCYALYEQLLYDLLNVDNILSSIIGVIQNPDLIRLKNIKPLLIIKKLIEKPEDIFNLNFDDFNTKMIYFQFNKYLWCLSKYDKVYILRFFTEKEYTYNDYKINSSQFIRTEPFYIDFKSNIYYNENSNLFRILYDQLSDRVLSFKRVEILLNQK